MCIGIITAVAYIVHYTDHRVNVQIHNIQGVANNTAHMTLIDARRPTNHSVRAFTVSQINVGSQISVAVWCSGNTLVLINAVALHRARLVLGWVTAFG